ncbi:hypothetical protein RUMOBE_00762 [Blautia obeum ATCC 29174]|uniref:Uncharacterized protein n=1 Tax=Blautia obeum ATCC 29174 TaxID=411459 RepID=A5ZP45_9FIRM|nr:hypothetical protein RUMOBE_00762 [Blautia obeum ATCC 29174]
MIHLIYLLSQNGNAKICTSKTFLLFFIYLLFDTSKYIPISEFILGFQYLYSHLGIYSRT